MEFAKNFIDVEVLEYYDGPLLIHGKDVTRITLTSKGGEEGDTFDGSVGQFADSFFSNVDIENIKGFCKNMELTYKLYGQDYIISWFDVIDDGATNLWLAVKISADDLVKALSPNYREAITYGEAIKKSPAVYLCKNAFVDSNVATGELVTDLETLREGLPVDHAYLNQDAFDEFARDNPWILGARRDTSAAE